MVTAWGNGKAVTFPVNRRRMVLLALIVAGATGVAFSRNKHVEAEIAQFNRNYTAAHLRMDNAAIIAMWAEDGVTLLPGMAPLAGRENIGRWLDDVTSKMP